MKTKNSQRNRNEKISMSRRQFLQGSGGVVLCLPPLISLLPRELWAAPTGRVRRVILIPTEYGIDPGDFFPQTPAIAQQSKFSSVDADIYHTPLSVLPSTLSTALGTAFSSATLRSRMNIYEGMDVTNGSEIVSHTFGALAGVAKSAGELSSYQPIHGETIDNIISRSSAFYPSAVPLPVLRIQTRGGNCRFSFTRQGSNIQYQPFIQGDAAVFSKVFGGFDVGSDQTSNPDSEDKAFIIDRLLAHINILKNKRGISSTDSLFLNNFLDGVHQLQKGIAANTVSCTKPSLALEVKRSGQYWAFPGVFENESWGVQSCTKMIDNISEVIVNAFLCDQSRIVVWGNNIWQDTPISGYTMDAWFHSHDDGNGGPLTTARKHAYFLNRIAHLAERLAETPDPHSESGSLLDNSLILFTNEHSGVVSHGVFSVPTLTIGSLGDQIRTGYYLDCRQRPYTKSPYHESIGRPGKQLLISIMEACGLQRSDYVGIGDGKGFGDFDPYPFQSTDSRNYSRFAATHNNRLPFIHK